MEIHVIDLSNLSGNRPKETTIKLPNLPKWTMAEEIGYEPKTTFWDDFCIAELYGDPSPLHGIGDTYRRAFAEWKHDVIYITELSLVLNHRGFWWHTAAMRTNNVGFLRIRDIYFKLWSNLNDWAHNNLKGSDFEYYYKYTD